MSNQGLIKHTAQPSAQGRPVASTSVLAIRGAPAAAPAGAGAGAGAGTHSARSAAGGLSPITHRLEAEAPNPPVFRTTEGQGHKGYTRKDGCSLSLPSRSAAISVPGQRDGGVHKARAGSCAVILLGSLARSVPMP